MGLHLANYDDTILVSRKTEFLQPRFQYENKLLIMREGCLVEITTTSTELSRNKSSFTGDIVFIQIS